MSEQDKKLKNTQKKANNSVISDKESKSIVVLIKILSVLIIILTGLIIEAYINQHPVFGFLQYHVFKAKSIVSGSISIIILFLGIFVFGISLGISLLSNRQPNRIVNITILIATILVLSSFGLFFKSYNWELGVSKYISFISISAGCTLGLSRMSINNKSLFFNILNLLSLIFCITGVILFVK
jgi:hypothetical protein